MKLRYGYFFFRFCGVFILVILGVILIYIYYEIEGILIKDNLFSIKIF